MKRTTLLVCLALVAAACNRQSASESRVVDGFAVASNDRQKDQAARLSALGYVGGAQGKSTNAALSAPAAEAPKSPVTPVVTSSLKLIWTASLQIEVSDYKKAVEEASRAAKSFGGYVSDRQSSEDEGGHDRGTITLRIPSDRFDGAVSALKSLGRIRSEGIKTQDVSKEYADLETRLKVKRETATRLREILVRQTGKVAEVLEVEREIARVVEEIEQAEGERRFFDNLVSLSTITLTLYEPAAMVAPGALEPLWSALRQSMHTMSESVAALILISAGLLPWIVALYVIFRLGKWRFSRRSIKAASALPPQ